MAKTSTQRTYECRARKRENLEAAIRTLNSAASYSTDRAVLYHIAKALTHLHRIGKL